MTEQVNDSALQTTYVDPEIAAALTIYQRLEPLQNALGLADLTAAEMQLFAMVAHHTGLDPFTKQIYAIKRGGKVMHQTGIDGYRSTAERTKEYRGSDPADYEPCDCGEQNSPTDHPKVARVTVYRAYPDGIRPQVGEARWHELKPKHQASRNGGSFLDDMWWQMPYNQLAKCAEANGLRKAFPRVLGGVYITEEMEQANTAENPALVEAAAQPTVKERVSARRKAIEAPPVTKLVEPGPMDDLVEQAQADADELVDPPSEPMFDGAPIHAKTVSIPAAPEPRQDDPGSTDDPDATNPIATPATPAPGEPGCRWRLAVKGGDILGCDFAEMHIGDHSWVETAMTVGGKVLRPE